MGKKKRSMKLTIWGVWTPEGKKDLVIRVPYPRPMSKIERDAFSDGVGEAASHILNHTQPGPNRSGFKTGFAAVQMDKE